MALPLEIPVESLMHRRETDGNGNDCQRQELQSLPVIMNFPHSSK